MQQSFSGLNMPVFAAFGWAGEENALKYAFSQLESFIATLHANSSRNVQVQFPFFGLNKEGQGVYLASSLSTASEPYIAFYARPASLELQLAITDKMALAKAWQAVKATPDQWRRLLTNLGPDWSLRVQQMEFDEETERTSFYQDLFKDTVDKVDDQEATKIAERAAFLNSEPKWIVPLSLSLRIPAEQVALMGGAVIKTMNNHVNMLMPLVEFMARRGRDNRPAAKPAKPRSATSAKEAPVVERPAPTPIATVATLDQFTFTSELKPLHIRRGFVNLTAAHWPFFASTARSETRPVTIYYGGRYDRNSAVWRLVPDDTARVVLSDNVRRWLEDNFNPDDHIQVTATKLQNNEIELKLEATG